MATLAARPLSSAEPSVPLRERLFPNNEWVLLIVILVECVVFGIGGHNFATLGNAFEITRLAVEKFVKQEIHIPVRGLFITRQKSGAPTLVF